MSTCARCGATFSCAMSAGEEAAAASRGHLANIDAGVGDIDNVASASSAAPGRCWCTYLPAAVALPSAAGGACWCPSCLAAQIAAAEGLRNGAK